MIGLVGKLTAETFLATMPKVLVRPSGISTMVPGASLRSEE